MSIVINIMSFTCMPSSYLLIGPRWDSESR